MLAKLYLDVTAYCNVSMVMSSCESIQAFLLVSCLVGLATSLTPCLIFDNMVMCKKGFSSNIPTPEDNTSLNLSKFFNGKDT